jgi:hypothetical protein
MLREHNPDGWKKRGRDWRGRADKPDLTYLDAARRILPRLPKLASEVAALARREALAREAYLRAYGQDTYLYRTAPWTMPQPRPSEEQRWALDRRWCERCNTWHPVSSRPRQRDDDAF